MSPVGYGAVLFTVSAPRASGDEPYYQVDQVFELECSPRERG